MDNSAKILLLGKTGVGKSSFINYFLGEDVAKTGAGKPITQEITAYKIVDGRYPIEIFDSKGIEAMTANEQMNDIISEIKKRNNGEEVLNWFHTIFYCTSVEKKFEDFEARFIKELQGEISQHIHIILTKCDMVEPKTVQNMKNTIKSDLNCDDIDIFEVVSVNKKFRDGTQAVQRGKEALSEQVFKLLWEDIASQLSMRYARSLRREFKSVADNTLKEAEELIDKLVNVKTFIEIMKDKNTADDRSNKLLDDLTDGLNKAIEETNRKFNHILKPAAKLYSSYKSIVTDFFAEDVELSFEDWTFGEWLIDIFDRLSDDEEISKIVFPNMVKAGLIKDGDVIDEHLTLWQLLKMITVYTGDLLTLKGRLKKFAKSAHQTVMDLLPPEEQVREEAYKRIIDYVKM